uniref:uncharacterized protein n=1 Tax=Lonchura striata TaxID=40157 RepID=UPI000B4DE398|nr:uncharacterized protein LOC110484610 [Lonchura striata domestica]
MFGSEGARRAAAAGRHSPDPLTGTPRCRRHDPAPGGRQRGAPTAPSRQNSTAAPGRAHCGHFPLPPAGHTPDISRSPRPGTLTAGRRPSGRRSRSLAASRRLKGATRGERLGQRRDRRAPPTRQNNQSAPSPGAQRRGDWRERPPRGQRPLPAARPPAAGAARGAAGPAAGEPRLRGRVRTSRGAPLRPTGHRWASRSRCCGSPSPQRRLLLRPLHPRALEQRGTAEAAGQVRGPRLTGA